MKIAVAQARAIKGDIARNIMNHKKLITLAIDQGAEYIFFPELSLIGYEPGLTKDLAIGISDSRLDELQEISNKNNITIGAGAPTRRKDGILITMIIFQPNKPRGAYSKQHLHSDELPFFINGESQVFIESTDQKIAPGICYETSLPVHWENAHNQGASVYVASVAKSATGVDKLNRIFPEMAKKYSMTVLMANSLGQEDNFVSAGQSAAWNNKGELVARLDDQHQGILLLNTVTGTVNEQYLQPQYS